MITRDDLLRNMRNYYCASCNEFLFNLSFESLHSASEEEILRMEFIGARSSNHSHWRLSNDDGSAGE